MNPMGFKSTIFNLNLGFKFWIRDFNNKLFNAIGIYEVFEKINFHELTL